MRVAALRSRWTGRFIMRLVLLPLVSVLVGGCGNGSPAPGELGAFQAGIQYEGSIAMEQPKLIELSAPLFPDSEVFQRFQDGSVYPTLSSAERLDLVDDSVRTFQELLPLCAAKHPAITLQVAGGPSLTAAEIAANYDEVARCAYEDYGAKPYWVPQHVNDVDICGRKLGADWRLPTEADVGAFAESDFEFFQTTLTAQPGNGWFPVHFYYSLDVYVQGSDGIVKLGNLAPQVDHVLPLPVSGGAITELYIGDGHPIGLRCLRLTTVTP
jgi:hypothetical protein